MPRHIVFYDTEYTTWEGAMQGGWSAPGQYKELVQIGAVRFDLDRLEETAEFLVLIKPVKNPVLSDYFVQLTGISNEHVQAEGLSFPDAYRQFLAFIGKDGCSSYGNDDAVVRINLALNDMPDSPDNFSGFDIHPWFQESGAAFGVTPRTNSGALANAVGARLEGIQEHNALHDARSICAAYRFLIQKGVQSPF